MRSTIPIIKGDKVDSNTDYRDALPVNFTAVQRNIKGASGYLLTHSGLTQHSAGAGVDRGGFWNSNQQAHYRVSGNKLISIDSGGEVAEIGDMSGSAQVSMDNSFNTQAVLADGKFYLYDGVALSQVTDPDIGTPIDFCWIDGFYFFTDGDFLYHTNLADESTLSPEDLSVSQFSPDKTLAVAKTSDNQAIVFNRFTTEYFINRSSTLFSFQRIQNKAVKCGIVGTYCQTELDGNFYILGGGSEESNSVHVISSGSYQSVATREVGKIIAQYSDYDLKYSVLETRVVDRDKFVIVRLPNETLEFNATIAKTMGLEAAWSIVKSSIPAGGQWRAVNGVHDPRLPGWIYGDNQTSIIGVLDESVATQYGDKVEAILYTPIVDLESVSIDEIELDIIPGFNVDLEETTAAFSITYDGILYSSEWWLLYGRQFNYDQRFIARRLGYVRENIGFKVRVASKNRTAFSMFGVTYG